MRFRFKTIIELLEYGYQLSLSGDRLTISNRTEADQLPFYFLGRECSTIGTKNYKLDIFTELEKEE